MPEIQEMLPSQRVRSTTASRARWDSINGLKIAINQCFKTGILQLEIKTWFPLLASRKCIFCALGRETMATAVCSFSWDHVSTLRGKEVWGSLQACSVQVTVWGVRQIKCWRLSPVAALLLDRCCEWMWAVRFQQDETIRISQAVNFL